MAVVVPIREWPRPATCVTLGAALGLPREGVSRWLKRLGRYRAFGSGSRLHLSTADVVAVAVAHAVSGPREAGGQWTHVERRAMFAAEAAAEHPAAAHVVATPDWAHAYETAEGALIGWCAAGRPVAAFVPLQAVLRPVEHLLAVAS